MNSNNQIKTRNRSRIVALDDYNDRPFRVYIPLLQDEQLTELSKLGLSRGVSIALPKRIKTPQGKVKITPIEFIYL